MLKEKSAIKLYDWNYSVEHHGLNSLPQTNYIFQDVFKIVFVMSFLTRLKAFCLGLFSQFPIARITKNGADF